MSPPDVSLETFIERFPYSNPFEENRVTQTDSLIGDVPQIHAVNFDELTLHARKAAQIKDKGRGVVVTGPPGVGKSHVLARFGDWARVEKYPFIYLLNLQAGPNDILRTILRTSISILTKGLAKSPAETRLYRMVTATINHVLATRNIHSPIDLKTARDAYVEMLNDLQHDGSVYDVLWTFFEDVYNQTIGKSTGEKAELAKRWLSGGYLDPDEARQLNLKVVSKSEDGCVLDLDQMKDVLKVLCQFAGYRNRSFILCFDQVDTMSDEQVRSWSTTTHALLDLCPGLLVVTTGVDTTFADWRQRGLYALASWDRIRQWTIVLTGIEGDVARIMVRGRLENALAPYDSLAEVSRIRSRDPFFPLGNDWAKQTLEGEDCNPKMNLRPRDIINRACSVWSEQCAELRKRGATAWFTSWPQHDLQTRKYDLVQLIDQKIGSKLTEYYNMRLLRREELPVDAGNVVGLLKSMLTSCQKACPEIRTSEYARFSGFDVASLKARTKPAFQMVVEQLPESPNGEKRKIGVAVVEASSGNAATNMLKRILDQLDGPNPPSKAVVVVDAREPLKLAKTGQTHLNMLQSRSGRFSVETLDFEQYATLDSYEGVIGLARAGDLEAVLPDGTGRPISEAEVYESHHRNKRYLTPKILCQLIGKCETQDRVQFPAIDQNDILEVTHARLALNPGTTTRELASWWMAHRQLQHSDECYSAVHAEFILVVMKLHEEGKVIATPVNDQYIVLPKRSLMEPPA